MLSLPPAPFNKSQQLHPRCQSINKYKGVLPSASSFSPQYHTRTQLTNTKLNSPHTIIPIFSHFTSQSSTATMEAAATAAAQGASAASKVNASTPTTGTGTPLMIVVTYLLYVQCALIVLLALPYHVPYRKELMQYIHNSPK